MFQKLIEIRQEAACSFGMSQHHWSEGERERYVIKVQMQYERKREGGLQERGGRGLIVQTTRRGWG